MAEFNFLPPKKILPEEEQANQHRALVYVILFLFVALIPTLVSILIVSNQDTKINDLDSKKQLLTRQIENSHDKIAQVSEVKNKISGIKYILDSQFDYPGTLQSFFKLLPPGSNLRSVSVNKLGLVKAELGASDSNVLKTFISSLSLPETNFKEIVLGNINYRGKSSYDLAVSYRVASPNNVSNEKKL